MNKLGFIVICFSFFLRFQAQQLPVYANWMNQLISVNPAATALKGVTQVSSLCRLQWVGYTGAPISGVASLQGILGKPSSTPTTQKGFSIRFEQDRIGKFNSNRLALGYAAHFPLAGAGKLSFGAHFGVIQTGYDPSQGSVLEPDPTVFKASNFVLPDFSTGFLVQGKHFFAGAAIQQVLRGKWENIGLGSNYSMHTRLHAGYGLELSETVTLIPATLIQVVKGAPLMIQIQSQVAYNQRVKLGFGYRNQDAVLAFFGLKVSNKFSMNYCYEYGISPISKSLVGSHELGLSFSVIKHDLVKSEKVYLVE
jgi:type IX secretion system PorP/SprF family membrane protein